MCLSTPFLTVTPRDLGPVGAIALWWLPFILIFYGGSFVLQQVAPEDVDTLGPVLLVVGRGGRRPDILAPQTIRHLGPEWLDYPAGGPSKVLIVRTRGRRGVRAALGAAHIMSWISGRLWLIPRPQALFGATVNTVENWRAALSGIDD